MVRKFGKRKRKALAKAKRQKGLKDIPTDNITKLLYVGQELRELAKENGVDYCRIEEDKEKTGDSWEPDRVEPSGLTYTERRQIQVLQLQQRIK
tara:strand:+ start:178 stop:459 length:282 start_codon:yes stop_codon:yes gene_type:complete